MSKSEDKSAYRSNLKKEDNKLNPNNQLKLCPFQGFRICTDKCNFYICRGRPNIIDERIKKGYASKYFTSTLF